MKGKKCGKRLFRGQEDVGGKLPNDYVKEGWP